MPWKLPGGEGTAKDITKVAVDKDESYFASLSAACVVSHVGGIGRKHLVESKGTPKTVTSIARYYVYYHMKRITEDPRKMNSYITSEMKELVKGRNLEKEVREDPGEHQPLVSTAPEQEEHQKVPLRDDKEQHGRARDRILGGRRRDA